MKRSISFLFCDLMAHAFHGKFVCKAQLCDTMLNLIRTYKQSIFHQGVFIIGCCLSGFLCVHELSLTCFDSVFFVISISTVMSLQYSNDLLPLYLT